MSLSHIVESVCLDDLARNPHLTKEVQSHLIRLGFLDPPADGKFGAFSVQALKNLQKRMRINESDLGKRTVEYLLGLDRDILFDLGNDFASRIVKYMLFKKYFVSIGPRRYNVVYVEGANIDGKPNKDKMNQWNDRGIVFEIPQQAKPVMLDNSAATTEPGWTYTSRPLNRDGAFRISFGQYKAWKVGVHKDHEALVQAAPITGYRDRNKDGFRTGDPIVRGTYGINQHWGGDAAEVGPWSAGCLVRQSRQNHRNFMKILKGDERYELNSNYVFLTTIIPGDELAKIFPG